MVRKKIKNVSQVSWTWFHIELIFVHENLSVIFIMEKKIFVVKKY